MGDVHSPILELDLTTGEQTGDSKYEFNFAFSIYNLAKQEFTYDYAKIGNLQAYLSYWKYNQET